MVNMSNVPGVPNVPGPRNDGGEGSRGETQEAVHGGVRPTVAVIAAVVLTMTALAGVAMASAGVFGDHRAAAEAGQASSGSASQHREKANIVPEQSGKSPAKSTAKSTATTKSQSSSSDTTQSGSSRSGNGTTAQSAPAPTTTASDVRTRASQLSHTMTAITEAPVAGTEGSTYDLLANNGKSDSEPYASTETELTNRLKVDTQYPDGRSSSQCARELNALNIAYANWEASYYKTLNDTINATADDAAQSAARLGSSNPGYCPGLDPILDQRPEKGVTRQAFESQTAWYDRLMDQWQSCEAQAAQ
ncbi:hypothetical protein DF200_05550 [Bifidobacterium catulorum]|uniref:Uncharacterized protein n=2 Tax=Bifidobacterium catulorum TaxID=1630173 RepID=A0A2U2MSI5_9BIFI|nr:hypothetical protein DF200_05550 [Bifidobacterium catulorum]